MQEVEKLKLLQSEREALKSRIKVKEQEKKAENHTETVARSAVAGSSSMIMNGQNWSARHVGL